MSIYFCTPQVIYAMHNPVLILPLTFKYAHIGNPNLYLIRIKKNDSKIIFKSVRSVSLLTTSVSSCWHTV